MSTDDELLAQMAITEESPDDPRQRRVVKPVYAKSQYKLEELKEKFGERVWVKCITDAKPWADEKPMAMWKDYFIPVNEAILLDERRFAVILVDQETYVSMTGKKELAKPAPKPALVKEVDGKKQVTARKQSK